VGNKGAGGFGGRSPLSIKEPIGCIGGEGSTQMKEEKMERQTKENGTEEILDSFDDWVRENFSREMMSWGKACLHYEYWKLLYFKKRIRKCATKGWTEGLREAIEDYMKFASQIREKHDRHRAGPKSTNSRFRARDAR